MRSCDNDMSLLVKPCRFFAEASRRSTSLNSIRVVDLQKHDSLDKSIQKQLRRIIALARHGLILSRVDDRDQENDRPKDSFLALEDQVCERLQFVPCEEDDFCDVEDDADDADDH